MRKLIALFLILLLSPLPALAAFGAATAWDVRTTGVDTNGGAFDSGVGSPGTDESQGSGTAITVTLTGTTTGTGSPVFSSTTHGPGNFVHIASGSGCTTGWFEVLSQTAGVATFDHAMGVATNVCVGVIGGSLLTIGQANTNVVLGNTIWIKTGTYTLTSGISVNASVTSLTFNGYGTTHGDNGTAPLITTATNSVDLFATNNASASFGTFVWSDLSLSNTAATRGIGIVPLSAHQNVTLWIAKNDKFDGFLNALNSDDVGAHFSVGSVAILQTEIKNSTGDGAVIIASSGQLTFLTIDGSYMHNNAVNGINVDGGGGTPHVAITRSIFSANTADGFHTDTCASVFVANSDFAINTGNGFTDNSCGSVYSPAVSNSIFYGNGGYGLYTNSANPVFSWLAGHNNAFGANTTANTNQYVSGPTDVTLTANPFTSSGTGNFSLNSTAGGGAALKGAGYPGIFPGATSTGSLDVGAVQTGGGGTSAAGNFGVSN